MNYTDHLCLTPQYKMNDQHALHVDMADMQKSILCVQSEHMTGLPEIFTYESRRDAM